MIDSFSQLRGSCCASHDATMSRKSLFCEVDSHPRDPRRLDCSHSSALDSQISTFKGMSRKDRSGLKAKCRHLAAHVATMGPFAPRPSHPSHKRRHTKRRLVCGPQPNRVPWIAARFDYWGWPAKLVVRCLVSTSMAHACCAMVRHDDVQSCSGQVQSSIWVILG